MRGCDAPGSYHRNFGDFLGVVGGRKKIAHWAWRVGKIKMFWLFESVEESGGQMVVRKRGTNMCRLTGLTRAAPSVPSKTPLFAYARPSLRHRPANTFDGPLRHVQHYSLTVRQLTRVNCAQLLSYTTWELRLARHTRSKHRTRGESPAEAAARELTVCPVRVLCTLSAISPYLFSPRRNATRVVIGILRDVTFFFHQGRPRMVVSDRDLSSSCLQWDFDRVCPFYLSHRLSGLFRTEEMQPEWFSATNKETETTSTLDESLPPIPYDSIWLDDVHWMPPLLAIKFNEGT